MHVVIYRWRIKPELRDDFVEGWTAATRHYLGEGSAGSALFTAEDGTLTAIARWPDLDTLTTAAPSKLSEAMSARMADAVLERFPPVHLEGITDLWTALSTHQSLPETMS